jgi:uncharacterized cupredoxin-like copper-binding protein
VRRIGSRSIAVGLLVVMFLAIGARSGRADEGNDSHPAHIHTGSCANLGDVVAPLSDIGPSNLTNGTPVAGQTVGSASAVPVESSVTTVPMALKDIADGNHAINVHLSAEDIGEYIACGDVGGTVTGGADLAIGIAELNNSGYSGVALLHDNGDNTTTVSVYLTEKTEEAAPGAATPSASNTDVAITLQDFTITPSATTFKVGVPYTFTITNDGKAQHELVIEKATDVDVPLQASGHEAEAEAIDPGTVKTLQWTFTEPGEYQFACHVPGHFEAGMLVKVEVTA